MYRGDAEITPIPFPRIRRILLATLALLFGLQIFRVFLPTLIWFLGQYVGTLGLASYALATVGLTLLAPLVRRRLGEGGALAVSIGGLALARLGVQLLRAPAPDLLLATLGIGLWGWFIPLWCQSHRNRVHESHVPALAVAFPLAFLLDTSSRTLLLSYDLAWRNDGWATLAVATLVAVTLALLFRELTGDATEGALEEPSLNRVLPLAGLGPWLYVALAVTHNPAALAVRAWSDERAYLVINGFAALGAVAAVLCAGWPGSQRPAWALSAGALVTGALALHVANIEPVWLWVGLASFGTWASLGWVLGGAVRTGVLQPGIWRSTVAVFLALVLFLLVVTLVTEYDLYWSTPVAGASVALCGLWATRVDTGQKDGAFWSLNLLVSGAGIGVVLVVGIWASTLRPLHVVELALLEHPLRVLIYNIHHGIDADQNMDLEAIADVIAAQGADIVALNEVNRGRATNGFVDTLPLISRRLGIPYQFGATLADAQYGNALLSRYPLLDWDNIHYASNTTEVRGLLRAVIQVGGESVTVFATHLDHLSGPDHARREQVAQALTVWDGAPHTILAGDLNAEPDAPELAPIYSAGLVDALRAAGLEHVFTFWDRGPQRRIDYVFLTPDLTLVQAWVVESRASDHLPVVVDVRP
jgi:endonuclease/exonuclease/phosphatase family metal-dependent hydrolase